MDKNERLTEQEYYREAGPLGRIFCLELHLKTIFLDFNALKITDAGTIKARNVLERMAQTAAQLSDETREALRDIEPPVRI
ncbi:MAG: hypothetical protein V3R83_09890 [Gammaproteobacteria bacterium]